MRAPHIGLDGTFHSKSTWAHTHILFSLHTPVSSYVKHRKLHACASCRLCVLCTMHYVGSWSWTNLNKLVSSHSSFWWLWAFYIAHILFCSLVIFWHLIMLCKSGSCRPNSLHKPLTWIRLTTWRFSDHQSVITASVGLLYSACALQQIYVY